jgi:hypothetical protein
MERKRAVIWRGCRNNGYGKRRGMVRSRDERSWSGEGETGRLRSRKRRDGWI